MSEHFYIVARELQAKADELARTASDLLSYADQIAAQEIKEHAAREALQP